MKRKFSLVLVPALFVTFAVYSQDSIRTKNDKPGTPQSLQTSDQTRQSQVNVINSNTAPGQTINHAATVNNAGQTIVITNDNNGDNRVPTTPITPSRSADSTVENSAIHNGVRNVTNPIRNK